MEIMSKEKLIKLVEKEYNPAVSIYIPTQRYGKEINEGQAPLHLKNMRDEVQKKLIDRGFTKNEAAGFLKKVSNLIDDNSFWRHQSDSLVLFLGNGHFEYFNLPVKEEPFNYVGNQFFIKPVLPLFTNNGQFFLLTLSRSGVKLYICSRFSITEYYIADEVPEDIDEVLKYDVPEKSLQFRTQRIDTAYHGHGLPSDLDENNLLRYLERVDKGLLKVLANRQMPMVIAGLDELTGVFKKITKYPALADYLIGGNPDDLELLQLHAEAVEIMEKEFLEQQHTAKKKYLDFIKTGKTSSALEDIVLSAYYQKIDSLFIRENHDVFGLADPEQNKVQIQESKKQSNVELLNYAAIHVLKNGGTVYIVGSEEMPENDTIANAVYRFE